MKVYIGPYVNWIGPYQIAEKLLFWLNKYEDDRVHDFGTWLATDRNGNDSWLCKFCNWIHKKKKRKINIRIDKYDTWGMDHTLALIVLPMLKQLKETKHGSPMVDPEDAPTIGKGEETDFGHSDTLIHKRWDWVLDEMIYAFECEADDEWEEQFYSGEHDIQWEKLSNGNSRMIHGPNDTFKVDREAMDKAWARRKNGLRLFGKYYHGLWD